MIYYLEGFTELRKAITLMVILYYSNRIQIKTSKGKCVWGAVQEGPSARFQLSSPRDVLQAVPKIPAGTCDNIRSAANHKSSFKPWGLGLLLGHYVPT